LYIFNGMEVMVPLVS